MNTRKKRTVPEVIQAIRQCRGLVYLAADRLTIAPRTLYNYIGRYPSVKEALEDERGKLLDLAESKLYLAVEAGEPWAVTFVLRTIGKGRGYFDTREQAPGSVGVEMMGDDPYAKLDAKIRGILASVEKDEIIN